MGRGYLLALEGIDGSGTTTQAGLVAAHFAKAGREVLRTAEPSGGPVGRFIRSALADATLVSDDTLALLFAADRLDHLEREIEPALARGALVLTDRYLLSSLAYQSSYLPLPWVTELNARARRPDASVLLRVGAEVALSRRQSRGGPEERFDALARQRQIATAYDTVFALANVGATFVVDAEADLTVVTARLIALLEPLVRSADRGAT